MNLDDKIARCHREIASLLELQIKATTPGERLGALQGELDWRCELHFLERERRRQRWRRAAQFVGRCLGRLWRPAAG